MPRETLQQYRARNARGRKKDAEIGLLCDRVKAARGWSSSDLVEAWFAFRRETKAIGSDYEPWLRSQL